MEGGLLLDVVVRKGAAILELLSGEDQTLLIRRDALLVLDLGLHVLNRIRRVDVERDGLAQDLHGSAAKTKDEMEGGLLLDVVVREGAAILELLSGEDQTLLIGRDALLVLDLGLHVLNRIRRVDVERDGLACE